MKKFLAVLLSTALTGCSFNLPEPGIPTPSPITVPMAADTPAPAPEPTKKPEKKQEKKKVEHTYSDAEKAGMVVLVVLGFASIALVLGENIGQ